jgi:hypothetical protein
MNSRAAMMRILRPLPTPLQIGARPVLVSVLLAASALFIFLAPLVMPPSYLWLSNSISESAAQGLHNAWIARLGFLSFGMGVLWLALYRRSVWARGTYWMQLAFAVMMIGTGVFSHKPWMAGIPVDGTEDFLHSVTATGMGFAFAFGVIARFLQREKSAILPRIYDATAIFAASVLTPIGSVIPNIAGLLQRAMFAIAYLWFIHEALFPKGNHPNRTQQGSSGDAKQRRAG